MEINPNNLLSVQDVLADVMVIMDDEDNKQLTPGFYIAQVKNALDNLSFDVSFLSITTDEILSEDLIVEMPKGCFNLKQVHLFTGTPDKVGYTENCYHKKGSHSRGYNTGETSDVSGWNITDPFFRVSIWTNQLYYFSIQNGLLRFSDSCKSFPYVRLTYDGIPSRNMGEIKMIPPEVRMALTDWVTAKCAMALVKRDNRYRLIQIDAERRLDEYGLNGSWHNAKMRLVKLDSKKLKDAILYNSKLNF